MQPTLKKVLRWTVFGALGLELVYVVLMNAVLFSGIIEDKASTQDKRVNVAFSWDRAWSPWPFKAYVSGFRLKLEDPALQFRLSIDRAVANVAPLELLQRRFSASHVRASGVRFEVAPKVDRAGAIEARLNAFPWIEGFTRPAFLAEPPVPPLTTEERAQLWTVKIEDVQANVDELWGLEFRYKGPAQVEGAFEFAPLQRLKVEPTKLKFQGGMLSVGPHVLSDSFTGKLELTVAETDLVDASSTSLLKALTAHIQIETELKDLGVTQMYFPAVAVRGTGKVETDVELEHGRVLSQSTMKFSFPSLVARFREIDFEGRARATFAIAEKTNAPTLRASSGGTLRLPIPEEGPLSAEVSELNAVLVLSTDDLTASPTSRTSVVLGELKVEDSRPLTQASARMVPVIAPAVLGNGPLVASGTAHITPEYTLLRLKHASMGDAQLTGAAIPGAKGWNGVAAGRFGAVPIGLRLRNSEIIAEAFIPPTWLNVELLKAGIKPDDDAATPEQN